MTCQVIIYNWIKANYIKPDPFIIAGYHKIQNIIINTGIISIINSAFAHAYNNLNEADRADADKVFKEGIKYLEYTVSDVLGGVSVDHYVGVDMDTIPQLATVMGGVTVNVKEDIYENYGHGSGNGIRIHKGKQILSGKDLLYYSRYRSYAGGDIDRVAVQQSIIKAILEQFKNSNSFTKIPKIYNLIKDSIETDMTFADIASLGYKFKDFDTENLKTYTLPGNYGVLNSLSFWVVNQAERVQFIKELYGIEAKLLTQDPLTDGTSYNSSKDPGGGSGVTKPKDSSSDDKPSDTPSKPNDDNSGGSSGTNSGGNSGGGGSSSGGGDSSGGSSGGGDSSGGGGDSSGGDNSGGETGGGDTTPDTSN